MRPSLLLLLLLPLAGCSGGFTYQGRPLSLAPVTDAARSLNDSAYAAGARTGERLGISPPAETPAAGQWRPRSF